MAIDFIKLFHSSYPDLIFTSLDGTIYLFNEENSISIEKLTDSVNNSSGNFIRISTTDFHISLDTRENGGLLDLFNGKSLPDSVYAHLYSLNINVVKHTMVGRINLNLEKISRLYTINNIING